MWNNVLPPYHAVIASWNGRQLKAYLFILDVWHAVMMSLLLIKQCVIYLNGLLLLGTWAISMVHEHAFCFLICYKLYLTSLYYRDAIYLKSSGANIIFKPEKLWKNSFICKVWMLDGGVYCVFIFHLGRVILPLKETNILHYAIRFYTAVIQHGYYMDGSMY